VYARFCLGTHLEKKFEECIDYDDNSRREEKTERYLSGHYYSVIVVAYLRSECIRCLLTILICMDRYGKNIIG
jgi:hypothetical protein